MMRKIFGGAMAFSLVGAVLLGGVLAWQTEATVSDSNVVGTPSVAVSFTPNGTFLGPDGYAVLVGHIDVTNTGDFNLDAASPYGWVQILGVTVPPGQAACGNHNFQGAGTQLTLENPSYTAINLEQGDPVVSNALGVNIEVVAGAPGSCQGATVDWAATVVLTTVGG